VAHPSEVTCDFCGAPPDPGRVLEVGVRHPGVDEVRTVALRFCDSSHAAGFLAQGRLEELELVGGSAGGSAAPAARRGGVDRVVLALLAAFLVSLSLMLVGCWQIAQWVLA
jgi:hypothetical protein